MLRFVFPWIVLISLSLPAQAGDWTFVRGDFNQDGASDISDAEACLSYMFLPGSPAPACADAADSNDDGVLQVSDPVYLLSYLFIIGSPLPPAPFPNCGEDPTVDALTCDGPLSVCFGLSGPPEFTSTPGTDAQELVPYTYLATATDPDGGSITFSIILAPAGAEIEEIAGLLSWTPTTAQIGDHDFTLRATDDGGQFVDQSFTVSVSDVAIAPVITSIPTTTVAELELYQYAMTATDADGDVPITFSLTSAPLGASVDAVSGLVSWTPSSGQVGDHDFVARATDAAGDFSEQSFTVTVQDVAIPPAITSTPPTTAVELTLYQYAMTATDADGDVPITFSLTSAPLGASVDAVSGLVSWTPSSGQVGDHDFVARATDAAGDFSEQSFTVTVQDVATPPVITSTPPTTVAELALYQYAMTATDADLPIAFSLTNAPVGAEVDSVSGVISWTPSFVQVGDHDFVARATDAVGDFSEQSFTVTVQDVAIPPVITSTPTTTVEELTLYKYTMTATDADGDVPIAFSLTSAPIGVEVDAGTGLVSWTPSFDQVGDHDFIARATDAAGDFTEQMFTVTVEDVSIPPTITSTPPTSAIESELYEYMITATDADGDLPITFSLTQSPTGSSVEAGTGMLDWIPSGSQIGDHDFVVRATDNAGDFSEQAFTVTVADGNSAPTITSTPPLTADEGSLYTYDVDATDPDAGDVIAYSLLVAPGGASIDSTSGLVNWTPLSSQVGGNAFTVRATDLAGLFDEQSFVVDVSDVGLPPVFSSTPASVVTATAPYVYRAVANDPDGPSSIDYSLESGPAGMTVDSDGLLEWTPTPSQVGAQLVTIRATSEPASFTDQTFAIMVRAADEPAPDPCTIATEIDTSVVTPFAGSIEFLFASDTPVQTGVTAETFEPERIAVVRGHVKERGGAGLEGVLITIKDRPEFGSTVSQMTGHYDLVVNGGGEMIVCYRKSGYAPVCRKVNVPWQDYVVLDDVALVPYDPVVTTVDLSTGDPFQVAQGSIVTDADGTRCTTVLFPQGTSATLEFADGTSTPLSTLSVRATEYTVGEEGGLAMPAPLPPTSAYTFCVELSVDEAVDAGAKGVEFSQPVPVYLENFLDYPVGFPMPSGFFDPDLAQWIPCPNGIVLGIVEVIGGVAQIDVDGDDVADGASELAALGITAAEQTQIGSLYAAGQSVWRVPVSHFSTYDFNVALIRTDLVEVGVPELGDIDEEIGKPQKKGGGGGDGDEDDETCGSIIGIQSRTLGESIGITGTPYALRYSSRHTPGYGGYTVELEIPPLVGIAGMIEHLQFSMSVAGRYYDMMLEPADVLGGNTVSFTWDGLDAYDRRVQGEQLATFSGFVQSKYWVNITETFGTPGFPDTYYEIVVRSTEVTQYTPLGVDQIRIGGYDLTEEGLGGWSLDVHHRYDAANRKLVRGTGQVEDSTVVRKTAQPFLALSGGASGISDVFTTADGTVYVLESQFGFPPISTLSRVEGDGSLSLITSTPISDLTELPDGALLAAGDVYVYRINPNGTINTIAGNGSDQLSGLDGPAAQAGLGTVKSIAYDGQGGYYLSVTSGFVFFATDHLLHVGPDGILREIAGGGALSPDQLCVPGDDTDFVATFGQDLALSPLSNSYLGRIAMGPNGLYAVVSGRMILRFDESGFANHVIGSCVTGGTYSGDGGPASEAETNNPVDLTFGPDGTMYLLETNRVRRIAADSTITTVAGGGTVPGSAIPTEMQLSPSGAAVAENGDLLIAAGTAVWRIADTEETLVDDQRLVPSASGAEVYVFDEGGKHLSTLDGLTYAPIRTFEYDAEGLLVVVRDRQGLATMIERDVDGMPLAIVGPYGHTTVLETAGGAGRLSAIDLPAPAGEQRRYEFVYDANGLLTEMSDPRVLATPGATPYLFVYEDGLLVSDTDPTGATQTLERIVNGPDDFTIVHTTAENVVTEFRSQLAPDGTLTRSRTASACGCARTAVTQPDGSATITRADGTVIEIEMADSPIWGASVREISRTTVTIPSGPQAIVEWTRSATLDDPGDPLSVTSRSVERTLDGATGGFHWDAATGLVTFTTPTGREATMVVDALGRTTSLDLPGIAPFFLGYDPSTGLVTSMEQQGSVESITGSATYAQGSPESLMDAIGEVWQFQWDEAERPESTTYPDTGQSITTYGPGDSPASYAPPGQPAYGFTTDLRGLLTGVTEPEVLGSVAMTSRAHDGDRRLTEVAHPTGETATLTYDANGRVSTIADDEGTRTFLYDAAARLVEIDSTADQPVQFDYVGPLLSAYTWPGLGSVGFTYDDRLEIASVSVNGDSILYQLDADGVPIAAGALTLNHDPVTGFLSDWSVGNSGATLATDEFGDLTQLTASSFGALVYSADYVHDLRHRMASMTEVAEGVARTVEYHYDAVGRLTQVTVDSVVSAEYAYDVNGNRLSRTAGGTTTSGTYDARDRLVSYGDWMYTYDASGHVMSRTDTSTSDVTTYDYDRTGNVRSVTLPNGDTVDYTIDTAGRRVGRSINGTPTHGFLYQDVLRPVAELDGSGAVVSRFVYASEPNCPDYMIRGGSTYFFVKDHLSSPRLIVDVDTGAIVQRLDYDAFGVVTLDTNPGLQPFGFAGGLYDPATALVRFGVRDYDASIGRWATPDPIGFAGGPNRYSYCGQDPVNFVDPDGRKKKSRWTRFWDSVEELLEDFKELFDTGKDAYDKTKKGCEKTDAIEDKLDALNDAEDEFDTLRELTETATDALDSVPNPAGDFIGEAAGESIGRGIDAIDEISDRGANSGADLPNVKKEDFHSADEMFGASREKYPGFWDFIDRILGR